MFLRLIPVGPLRTNCYLVADDDKNGVVIDPGDQPEKILKVINQQNLQIKYILNTHAHYDHIGANASLKAKTGAPLLFHPQDQLLFKVMRGFPQVNSPQPDGWLAEGQELIIGGLKLIVWHTPGHSPGGVCFLMPEEKIIFSGDTLFAGTWGRYDLPGSSATDLLTSLQRLLTLAPATKVYPGHGYATTIGAEKDLLASF